MIAEKRLLAPETIEFQEWRCYVLLSSDVRVSEADLGFHGRHPLASIQLVHGSRRDFVLMCQCSK